MPSSMTSAPVLGRRSLPFLGLALALVGCTDPGPAADAGAEGSPAEDLLREAGLEGMDAAAIIDRLDAQAPAERPAELLASVRTDVLLLSDAQGREASLPLPEDRVYISVAPYREGTHDCFFHSLTTCLGELPDEPMQVSVRGADGASLIDEERTTFANGFLGLWLPRGIEATLSLVHAGGGARTELSTRSPEDPTCLTGLQLR
ncbi:CueP family metal-binding protein [Brachybacterium hainanense]|uniref:CueP family metal-binding protein n=1 Tax=Brachybacterium hainanense TaxID=1541174 RepID=A0ABV6R914_9MICO